MKKLLSILSICLVVVGVAGCFGGSSSKNIQSQHHKELIESDQIQLTDTIIHDDSEYVVYFTMDGCPNCDIVDPKIVEFAKTKKMPVYVYDIDKETWAETPFGNIENKDFQFPAPVTDEVYIQYTPSLFHVKDGQIVNYVWGTNQVPAVISELSNQ